MSGNSSVGQASVYEAGDQRNYKQSEINKSEPYNEGKTNSHDTLDSKDERSIANRLAAAERQGEQEEDLETKLLKKDPTLPATLHGNEPSKGAKIDAELQAEEQELLKKKGKA
ncbi:unnamed protein product [Clonostachys rosea f. rosea IK726]|uniref:Uncharacterized protein n=2 Tax=Bionectria ochroleuca TaxID=29856 RepID=A0A0B7KQJ0_BIOOC|nr:unnamed protein product [Clonostachys rosea f. rosea IK726]